jgi:tRNA threonylcarbamoyl adenosine modification protein YeaZ
MADQLVLALDGSTEVCSAALLKVGEDGPWEVVARRSEADGRAQAKTLLRLMDEMLEECGRGPEHLGAVVVGKGPGTFTGVRVTVATARALSLALAVPVAGLSTLAGLVAGGAEIAEGADSLSMAARASTAEVRLVVPVTDARRGQVFYGLYRLVGAGGPEDRHLWRRSTDFAVCDREALGEVAASGLEMGSSAVVLGEKGLRPVELPAGVVFVSHDVAAENLVIGQERLEEPGSLPEGARLRVWLEKALLAGTIGSPGAPGSPESVAPVYVRSPDADVHITRMRDPWADAAGGR